MVKVTQRFLNDFTQTQLRTYDSKGKYLQPIKNWYKIGNEWGLKIKKGHYKMLTETKFVESLNKTLDEYDKKKILYELMFFDGSVHYREIHNFKTDGWDADYSKITPRKMSSFVD